jgi:hypothetical protein
VQFSSDEVADLERSINRLVLAAQDMVECSAAVNHLLEKDDLSGDYARPWGKSNTIGPLGSH